MIPEWLQWSAAVLSMTRLPIDLYLAYLLYKSYKTNQTIHIHVEKVKSNIEKTLEHHDAFAGVYERMDQVSAENARVIADLIEKTNENIDTQLERIRRRENTLFNTIKEHTAFLMEHDQRKQDLIKTVELLSYKINQKNGQTPN